MYVKDILFIFLSLMCMYVCVRGGMGVNERVLWGMQAMCVERGMLKVV